MASASVVSLVPSLLSRKIPFDGYSESLISFSASDNTGPVTLRINGGPVHSIMRVEASLDRKIWRVVGDGERPLLNMGDVREGEYLRLRFA